MRDVTTASASPEATGTADRRRRRPSSSAVVPPEAVEEPVRAVWQAYLETIGTKAVLTQARVALIRSRLADGWSADELVSCVRGYGQSEWHFGANDRGRRFTDIELWLRDAKHIEQGLSFGCRKPVAAAGSVKKFAETDNSAAAAMSRARSIEERWEDWERRGCPGLDGKPTVGVLA